MSRLNEIIKEYLAPKMQNAADLINAVEEKAAEIDIERVDGEDRMTISTDAWEELNRRIASLHQYGNKVSRKVFGFTFHQPSDTPPPAGGVVVFSSDPDKSEPTPPPPGPK